MLDISATQQQVILIKIINSLLFKFSLPPFIFCLEVFFSVFTAFKELSGIVFVLQLNVECRLRNTKET